MSIIEGLPTHLKPSVLSRLEGFRRRLHPYRPRFRDLRFWVVQGLVVGIAGVHDLIEAGGHLPAFGMLYFLPISLFFVPVIYAALNFGFAGSVATALWATLITVPNWVFWHHGFERWGVIFQMVIVNAIAVFVGQRVDREAGARQRAETASAALKASETRFRNLFESSPVAVLVLDPSGSVLDSNPAAGAIFDMESDALKGAALVDLFGSTNAEALLHSSHGKREQSSDLHLSLKDGSEVYLEPSVVRTIDDEGKSVVQAILRDVTLERQQQAGMRTYAAYVLRVQEEERKRIAHELHDDSVHTLVLLCRQLDSVESTGGRLPPQVIEGLQRARGLAEEVMEGLRDFAGLLRPPTLDDLGLVTSIRRYVRDLAEDADIEARLDVVGKERRLSQDTELGIFRVAQEALRNVERHAQATRVSVSVTFTGHEVNLEVVDNGVGFVAPTPGRFVSSGQLGLLEMHERAELLGGRLEIESSPGQGTRVTLSV